MKKRKQAEVEAFIPQSEIPREGPALVFDAEGDLAEALIQALLDEAPCLNREPESMVFVVEGGRTCRLAFTEPAPMPLVKAMIRHLGGGSWSPERLEKLRLRPLLRIDETGFSLFVRPVLPEAEA